MRARRTIPIGASAMLGMLAAVLAAAPGVDAKRADAATSCTPVSNIEAIIDDSGSHQPATSAESQAAAILAK